MKRLLKDFNKRIIENSKDFLNSSKKYKIVCISTTANLNNPDAYFASLRESENSITFTIIIKDSKYISDIIVFFDSKVDYFLLDTESKSKINRLVKICEDQIATSRILYFKPNDLTVETVKKYFLWHKIKEKNIFIYGLGNIGTKLALFLSEISNNIYIHSSNVGKAKEICGALNQISKSDRHIQVLGNKKISADYIIGTSAGMPVITKKDIGLLTHNGLIIDVGNGTIKQDAIEKALKENKKIICTNIIEEYSLFIEHAISQVDIKPTVDKSKIGKYTFVKVGMIGQRNDILVDDPANIKKIFGVCNGKGDLLYDDRIDNSIKEIRKAIGLENDKQIRK